MRMCEEWPGLSALPLMRDGNSRTFPWFDWSRRSESNLSRKTSRFDGRWSNREELRLTSLPVEWLRERKALRRFLRQTTAAIQANAARTYRRVLGVAGVLRQRPQRRPARLERKPRPLCHTTVSSLREEYRERYRAFAAAFREASARWKAGDFQAQFPELAFRPFVWPASSAAQLAA